MKINTTQEIHDYLNNIFCCNLKYRREILHYYTQHFHSLYIRILQDMKYCSTISGYKLKIFKRENDNK